MAEICGKHTLKNSKMIRVGKNRGKLQDKMKDARVWIKFQCHLHKS